jgi:hypothetical protein
MRDSWHDAEEEYLKKLENQANILHKHYSKEYTYYNQLATKFNIPILVVSSINALTAIALSQFVEQTMVSILNAVLSAGTGVLGSIQLYMKLNEKMGKALSSSIHMKRIALKISKELSIDRDQRSVEGIAFLNECFTEFTTTIEQGNPLEKTVENTLSLTPPPKSHKPGSLASLAAALVTPRESPAGGSPRTFALDHTRAQSLWSKMRHEVVDHSSSASSEV